MALDEAIPQAPLPQELKAELRRAVTDRTVAKTCIEELEQALVIMIDSIKEAEVSGDSKLWSVLMLRSEIFGDVRLKHIRALNEFLVQQIDTSEFAMVHANYKNKLADSFTFDWISYAAPEAAVVQALEQQAKDVDGLGTIMEVLVEFMQEQLGGSGVVRGRSLLFACCCVCWRPCRPSCVVFVDPFVFVRCGAIVSQDACLSICESVLGSYDTELEDTGFMELFPYFAGKDTPPQSTKGLRMGHFAEVYKILDREHSFSSEE